MNRKPIHLSVVLGLSCALLLILSALLQPASQKGAAHSLLDPQPQIDERTSEDTLIKVKEALDVEKPPDDASSGTMPQQESGVTAYTPPPNRMPPQGFSPRLPPK